MKSTEKKWSFISELEKLRHQVKEKDQESGLANAAMDALSIIFDAVDSTVGGVLITDNRGCIVYVNPSFVRMFEYADRDEIIGRNAGELFAAEGIKSLTDVMSIINKADSETHEFEALRKDGSPFFVEVSVTNVTNQYGVRLGKMASFVNITKRRQVEKEKENLIKDLQFALAKVKVLSGLVPICSNCKKIRDDKGYWNQLEQYISEHSDAIFSHSICPDCVKVLYPEFVNLIKL